MYVCMYVCMYTCIATFEDLAEDYRQFGPPSVTTHFIKHASTLNFSNFARLKRGVTTDDGTHHMVTLSP